MSHGIKKETYVEADEKTTKALTYDLLSKVYDKVENLQSMHAGHLETCDVRFHKLENRKRHDTRISGLFGFLGGFVAFCIYWIKELVTFK